MRVLPLAVLLALSPVGPLAAQSLLRGRIISDDSIPVPISGVELLIEGTSHSARTDTAGKFSLAGVPNGVAFTTVRRIGYRPIRLRTIVVAVDTLEIEIRMRQTALELPPLEVVARYVPPRMHGYADRRLSGFGSFLDPDLLRASENRRLIDLLRSVRGLRITPSRGSRYIAMSSRGNCLMSVWLDGIRIYVPGDPGGPPDINQFPITDLEAVEIYRGSAELPMELAGSGAPCGALVLWTRRGG